MSETTSAVGDLAIERKIPNKRWLYVIPVAVVMYMLAYVDRNNVSIILPYIAKQTPKMNLSAADKGLISGIFFVGYMVLQIPGALLAKKWSARKTVVILMILWSAVAMLTALVQSRGEFIWMRLLLGVFEGGIWPSVLVLLATWFPLKERARANSLWMICLPLASIIMSPISGVLLNHVSWRWVFFIEGFPPLIWAIVWWFTVKDVPSQAPWLSREEGAYISSQMAKDEAAAPKLEHANYFDALKSARTWLLIIIYFCYMAGFYGFSLWLPSVVKNLTHNGSAGEVGWITAIPYACALVAMVLVSMWCDRTRNRRLAIAVPMVVALVVMVIGQQIHNNAGLSIILLCVVGMGVFAPYGPYWVVPAETLSPAVLAFSLGLINALGNLGGFLGPYMVGWLHNNQTNSDANGFYFLAGLLLVGAVLTLLVVKSPNRIGAYADGSGKK